MVPPSDGDPDSSDASCLHAPMGLCSQMKKDKGQIAGRGGWKFAECRRCILAQQGCAHSISVQEWWIFL